LKSAEHRATAFPMSIIDAVPFLGSPGRAAKDTARAGYRVVNAGQLLADAAADFPTTSGKTGVEGHDLSNIHAAAVRSGTALQQADDELRSAQEQLKGPRSAILPFVSGAVGPVDKVLKETITQLEAGQRGMKLLADL